MRSKLIDKETENHMPRKKPIATATQTVLSSVINSH